MIDLDEYCLLHRNELIDRLQRAEMELAAWRDNSNSWQEQCERAEATFRELEHCLTHTARDDLRWSAIGIIDAYFAANEKEKL